MMQKGKKQFIADWGLRRFLYAYTMLMLKRFLGFRISAITGRAIADNKVESYQQDGFVFRTLTLDDFENDELNQQLDINKAFVEKRLTRGDQCVGALKNGIVVGYSWRTIESVEVDGPIWMSFTDSLYYHYKGFVSPDCRGNNLYLNMKKVKEKESLKAGRTHVFACIETHNYPSLIASSRNGERIIGYSAFIFNRIGFISWHSPGAKKWGVVTYRK